MGRKPIISLTLFISGLALAGCYPNNDQYRTGGTRRGFNTQQQQTGANGYTTGQPANGQRGAVTFPPGVNQPTGRQTNNMYIPTAGQTNTNFTTPHGAQGYPAGTNPYANVPANPMYPAGTATGVNTPAMPVYPPHNPYATGVNSGQQSQATPNVPNWPGRPVIGQSQGTLPPVSPPNQFNAGSQPLPLPPVGAPGS